MLKARGEFVRVGISEVSLEIVSEPYVVNTFRGFAPVVDAKVEGEESIKTIYISAKSLSEPLTPMIEENGDKFTGLKLKIRKESVENRSPYIVEKM